MIDIASIRQRLADPSRVCALLGLVATKRQPGGVWVLCPAHKERTPSCSITRGPDGTLRVRCFGCDLAGDVLHLVAAVRGLSTDRDFGAVVREAGELAGVEDASPPMPAAPAEPEPHRVSVLAFDALLAPLATLGRLDGGSALVEAVCAYLAARGLLEEARLDGWWGVPPQWAQPDLVAMMGAITCEMHHGEIGPEHALRWTLADIRTCGLFGRRGFVHEGHRLAIPWRDERGRVQTLQRRRLGPGRPPYVFPSGRRPAQPYGIDRLRAERPLVIVEGAIDVLARRALDRAQGLDRDVIGIPGVSSWVRDWAQLGAGREVFLGLDADAAGDKAAQRIASALWGVDGVLAVRRLRPEGVSDWADLLLHRRRAA